MVDRRGRLQPAETSWHWRWYQEWRRNKGYSGGGRQIDLCHYMRVLLFFGPWRWFWQGTLAVDLPAFFYVMVLTMIGFIVFSFVAFTGTSLFITYLLLATVLSAGVLLGIGYSIRRWYIKDTAAADAKIDRVLKVLEKIAYYGLKPIWWPLWKLGLGIKHMGLWLGDRIFSAGEYLFTKRLFRFSFGGELISVTPMGMLIPGVALFGIVYAFVAAPIVSLIVAASICVFVLLIVMVVLTIRRIQRYAREHSSIETIPEPRPAREPNIFWQWLVAKKHRICPLIDPPNTVARR